MVSILPGILSVATGNSDSSISVKFEMRKTALQNKLTLYSYSSNGKQTAERLLIYQVLSCFGVV